MNTRNVPQILYKSIQQSCANEVICILELIPELPELNTKDVYDNIMINTCTTYELSYEDFPVNPLHV